MLLALQFSILLLSSFIQDLLFSLFQEKKIFKKGKYPNGVQRFTILLEHRFVSRQRFQKKFDRWQFDQKMCLKRT